MHVLTNFQNKIFSNLYRGVPYLTKSFMSVLQASVVLDEIEWQGDYPMDFYASTSLGPWTVNNEHNRQVTVSRRRKNLYTEKRSSENMYSNMESKDGCDGQSTKCCGKCHQENLHTLNKEETNEEQCRENDSNDREQHSK